jgi:hypothetical protein
LVLGVMVFFARVPRARGVSPEEIEQKLKALEEQVGILKQELEETKRKAATPAPAPPPAAAPVVPAAPAAAAPAPATPVVQTAEPPSALAASLAALKPSWLSDIKIGAYGSTRFEASDLPSVGDSFTFRRFVLSGDATIADRIRSVFELEFERLTEIEVEKKTTAEGVPGLLLVAREQQQLGDLARAGLGRAAHDGLVEVQDGQYLVPVGRFNINHDDNKWDLPRRSLVDRGVPVLPSTAAWSEIGLGFNGDIKTDNWGTFNYSSTS